MSKHLSTLQIRGLNQLGTTMLPGEGDLASFAGSGCASEVDRILDHMPAQDLGDLKTLLLLMAFLPRFLIAGFLALLEASARWGAWAAPLRFVRIGVRGLVMTLYYSHPQAHRALGYQVGVYTDDLRAGAKPGRGAAQFSAVGRDLGL